MISILFTIVSLLPHLIIANENEIYVGPLDKFAETHPNTITMHFSCLESNMFATNCACHLKCKRTKTGNSCQNAVELCQKYRTSHGCKYVLTRNNNRIATLKREVTIEETKMFDVREYKSLYLQHPVKRSTMTFRDMIASSSEVSNTYNNIIKQAKVGDVCNE